MVKGLAGIGGLARGASLTFVARGVAMALGIVGSIIVARALGPEGKGEYALIVLIPAMLQLAGGLGLDQATVYLVARLRDRARSVTWVLAGAAAGLSVVLLAAYGLVARFPPYLRYLEGAGVDPGLVWILVALLPVTLVSQTATSAILGLERHRDYNLASLAPPAANLALLLVLVVALDLGLPGAVIAAGAGSVAGMAAAVALFLRATPRNDGPAWPGLVGEALRYGWRAHLANLAWFLHYRADMFLVGYMAGPAALGFYSVAVGLAEKLYMAPSAVGTVLFPRVAATAAAGAPDDVTDRACRHTLWLTLGLALILAAVGRPVIDLLYGADFLPSALPMWLLLPGVVSLALGRVVSADLNGRGRPGTVARANAGLAVANVALNLWWIPIWGAAGAAAATSVSYGAAALLLAWLYRRLSGSRWSDLLVYRRSDWSEFKGALVSLGGPGAREGTR